MGAMISAAAVGAAPREKKSRTCLVIHGGAGTILRRDLTAEAEKAFRQKLGEALRAGHAVLNGGGSSLDAVEAAIRVMEDSPLFNAGRGAVFNSKGEHELDASIMEGRTLMAGAVAGVRGIRNPITAARAVMEKSPHVMLVADGAEEFARAQGIDFEPPEYFHDDKRWKQLERARAKDEQALDHTPGDADEKFGTVGAVALDRDGNLAAGTSTGGMTNKKFGRVGDSPIIGAGTFADNASCAVSCTGHGEYFIRAGAARDIAALMAYKDWSVEKAASEVIHNRVGKLGGTGGAIALDAEGNFAMAFNTPGMYRGVVQSNGEVETLIFKDN